ncbi:MAG: hypothetical protein Q4D96_14240 [Propionibacteriaceae bacterium]|nr:hypothetical protein [Propionibacteriaceae bacterium]
MTTAAAEMPFPQDTRSLAYQLMADLQRLANSSAQTQLGRWDGRGVPGWVGEAEDAYTSSIKYLDGKLNQLIAALRHAAEQVGAWGDLLKQAIDIDIPNLHEAWEAVDEQEKSELQKMEVALKELKIDSFTALNWKIKAKSEAIEKRNDLRAKYKQLLQALDTEAAVLATRLGEARAMVLPPQTGGSRAEIGQSLFKDGSILEAQNRWEHSEQRAKEIAKELEKGFHPEGGFDEERLAAFVEEYGKDLEDPFVATRLGQLIPPEKLTEQALDSVAGFHSPELQGDFLAKIGTAMVLASGGVTLAPGAAVNQQLYLQFEKALPGTHDGDASLHEKYAQQMLQGGRTEIDRPWLREGPVKTVEAMAQLMGQAGLRNPHLMMGAEMIGAEDEEGTFLHELLRHDAEVLELSRAGVRYTDRRLVPGFDDHVQDPIFALTELMDQPEGFPGEPSQELLQENRGRVDAVREFLGSKVQGVGPGPINVTEHIMGGRTMVGGKVSHPGGADNYSGFPDGGVLFTGLAAEAAFPESEEGLSELSQPERDAWLRRDKLGTAIAEGYWKGYQHGLDTYRPAGAEDIEGQRPYGYENQAMRSLAPDVLGPRLKGVSIGLGGTDKMRSGMQEPGSGRHLVVLDDDTMKKVRGPGGVLVDLAFDGVDLQETAEEGESDNRRMTATEKMKFWASSGYADDLRKVINQDSPDSTPTSKVPVVTRAWTPVVETLFETPEGTSVQAQEAFKKRNEFWKPIAGDAGTLAGIAAAAMTGPIGGAVAGVATLGYQSLLDPLLPTDQDVTVDQQYSATTNFMMGTLSAVAAEKLDFSQAPTTPGEYLENNSQLPKVVGPSGEILPVGSMDPEALSAFQGYLVEGLSDWHFDEAKEMIAARAESTHARNREAGREE